MEDLDIWVCQLYFSACCKWYKQWDRTDTYIRI